MPRHTEHNTVPHNTLPERAFAHYYMPHVDLSDLPAWHHAGAHPERIRSEREMLELGVSGSAHVGVRGLCPEEYDAGR